MRLWLARHAAVQLAPGTCYGGLDVPADAVQTATAAARLAQALPVASLVWCSPLGRCRSLAAQLHTLRPDLQTVVDPRLAEMDFGQWEGQTWDAIGAAPVAAWSDDFMGHRPGGGESVAQVLARVGQALQAVQRERCDDALWITHAGVIKAVRLLLAGGPAITRADQWPRDSVACGDWVVLELPPPTGE